ncbi:LytR/AlgR family response regulator transcription factor [Flavihumibacter fluvii]|uniref:LytR/AlgR family response regulator transcription factor n=1 Tax=Flavihumibacter fluvii TaxID=2838157 RepID=UPI001BDEC0C6|nr:LytTR family DNA-binding domain-containing protein [Flavihumibacter fluvii]ULQ54462.1 LytTR family transcriptional regulator [Flavihumibacter fluvii]
MPFHPLKFKDAFSLLYAEKNRASFILFSGIYCFCFLYIFSPHNMSTWYEADYLGPAWVLLIFSLSAVAGLVLSRFILAKVFKDQNLTNSQYFLWFLGEVLLITATVNTSNVLMHNYLSFSFHEYLDTLRYTFLLLLQTYAIGLMWFYTREKSQELENLENTFKDAPKKANMLALTDEQDKPVISIDPENLVMIKAEDNYVQVYFIIGVDLKKELIRNSIKKLEPQIARHGFARIHRSYIVNYSKVVLFKKNSRGYHICLEGLDKMEIPVSASYLPAFSKIVSLTP